MNEQKDQKFSEDIWYFYKHWKALLFAFWAFFCVLGATLCAVLGFDGIARVLGGLALLIAAPFIIWGLILSVVSFFGD